MSDNPSYPLTLHHGTISRVWRNPNLFVTEDNVSDGGTSTDPIYDPVDSSRLEAGQNYYYVADVEWDESNPAPVSNPQINYYWANPSGGITPDELQPLSLAVDQSTVQIIPRGQGTRQIISRPNDIPNRGHFCLIAWITGDTFDHVTQYPATIPLKGNGTVDANHPLVAQRNIDVIEVPEGNSAMFQFSVPAGVNEIQIKRSPLAENRDLLEDSGMGNLNVEAKESPKMEIYEEGAGIPIHILNAEAVAESPILDLTEFPATKFTVRAELPEVDNPDTGAIYSFETPDEKDGVAIVLAYNQSEAPEQMEKGTEAWFEHKEKLFGKRRAELAKARWERMKAMAKKPGRGRGQGRRKLRRK